MNKHLTARLLRIYFNKIGNKMSSFNFDIFAYLENACETARNEGHPNVVLAIEKHIQDELKRVRVSQEARLKAKYGGDALAWESSYHHP